MGEICNISVGQKSKAIHNIPCEYLYINAGTTPSGYTDNSNCEEDTITTPSRGQGGIGYIGYQQRPFWLGPLCYSIKSHNSNIKTKYLYYYLKAFNTIIISLKNEGGTPAINRRDLAKVRIPIPPLEFQEKIVAILDRFETLVNDLTQGLPAEIAAVKEQYEFYRNRLLSFNCRVATCGDRNKIGRLNHLN